jgi:hypothetical protein
MRAPDWSGTGARCLTGAAETFSWQQALRRAARSRFAGYRDWRLANKNELASLVEERCVDPAVNGRFFPNTPLGLFWSSTPAVVWDGSFLNVAWCVYFDDGSVSPGCDRADERHHVRLVRGGQ